MSKRLTPVFNIVSVVMVALLFSFHGAAALAQGTSFTYQGKLSDGGVPANVPFDFQFKLFDGVGALQGGPLTVPNVTVTAGIFTVQLDFGACASCFNGSPRFLEIAVKKTIDSTFTTLSPRQPVTSNPYAIRSLNAGTADGLSVACVNCVTSSQIASAPAGSASSYVQNTTTQQPSANFNISGTGTANIFSAATQYNIGVQRMLSAPGGFNTFVGRLAGRDNTGGNNIFVGDSAGVTNTTGSSNAFFGTNAGQQNTTGGNNSFFGEQAGFSNSAGSSNNSFFGQGAGRSNAASDNSFFGTFAGADNSSGNGNSFFGKEAGRTNSDGFFNSFFGVLAGRANLLGSQNSVFGGLAGLANAGGGDNAFFGFFAGGSNFDGSSNSFFGVGAGSTNTSGSSNTMIGAGANVASNNLFNATAIGANALVSQSNSLVLGNNANVGIGTTAPQYKLHVVGQNVRVEGNSFPRFSLNFTGGAADAKRWQNYATTSALIFSALNDAEDAETFWLQVNRGIGRAILSVVFPNGSVGIGTNTPSATLDVNGNIRIATLGGAGVTQLCRDPFTKEIATCSSSRRYKQNINPFNPGLSLIKKLRPVSFNWKTNNQADMGLVAEEVNEVEPLLTTTNDKGEIEGVKYDRVGVVLVNAVQEQQRQIEAQQKQLERQKKQIDSLTQIVCSMNPRADMCKEREE